MDNDNLEDQLKSLSSRANENAEAIEQLKSIPSAISILSEQLKSMSQVISNSNSVEDAQFSDGEIHSDHGDSDSEFSELFQQNKRELLYNY